MKLRLRPYILSLLIAVFATALSHAQPADARVVHEDPDGAQIVRSGTPMALAAGDDLQEADVIKSNDSTVIVSLCDGSLVTIYPDSEVMFTGMQTGMVRLSIMRGEILGDTKADDGCEIAVGTLAGIIDVGSGVYGVLMNESVDGWTLQVRNLDGSVTFTGDAGLDTSNLTVSLIQPGETTEIPAGEEMIVRGIYDAVTEVFSLISGGASLSILPDDTKDSMIEGADAMQTTEPTTGKPSPPVVIEIPWGPIEIASDRGSTTP